jgi:hypothetical protein
VHDRPEGDSGDDDLVKHDIVLGARGDGLVCGSTS